MKLSLQINQLKISLAINRIRFELETSVSEIFPVSIIIVDENREDM
jgi:hypothetical protein